MATEAQKREKRDAQVIQSVCQIFERTRRKRSSSKVCLVAENADHGRRLLSMLDGRGGIHATCLVSSGVWQRVYRWGPGPGGEGGGATVHARTWNEAPRRAPWLEVVTEDAARARAEARRNMGGAREGAGRPGVRAEELVPLTVGVERSLHARLTLGARRSHVSVAEYVRRTLERSDRARRAAR